ncbi:STAS domain-containing protein [Actinomadura kijaniata]|uniref:STAS domain-containing protein n=1 Tax=Actinomadura kijaniata TaxID=46161 RepID=UPI000A015B0D|nr:STAS domain-containing protein [Actinomadura kijaniata]
MTLVIKETTPPDDAVEISRRVEGRWVVVSVAGDLDLATAPRLEATLDPSHLGEHKHVAIDTHRLRFIDSSGLNTLIRVWKRLRGAQGQLVLMRVPPSLGERLNWMGLDRFLTVTDTLPEPRNRDRFRVSAEPERRTTENA